MRRLYLLPEFITKVNSIFLLYFLIDFSKVSLYIRIALRLPVLKVKRLRMPKDEL